MGHAMQDMANAIIGSAATIAMLLIAVLTIVARVSATATRIEVKQDANAKATDSHDRRITHLERAVMRPTVVRAARRSAPEIEVEENFG